MLLQRVFLVLTMSSALTAAKAKGAGRDIFGSWWGYCGKEFSLGETKNARSKQF